jgi:hypothetical protein
MNKAIKKKLLFRRPCYIFLRHYICVHNAYHSSAGYHCNWHDNSIASGGYDKIVAEPVEPKIHPFYGYQKRKMGNFLQYFLYFLQIQVRIYFYGSGSRSTFRNPELWIWIRIRDTDPSWPFFRSKICFQISSKSLNL